jgi:hypothetical protein
LKVRPGMLLGMILSGRVTDSRNHRASSHGSGKCGPAQNPAVGRDLPWAERRTRLLYEPHLTSFSASPIELLGLDVFGGHGAVLLASYRGEELEKPLVAVGPTDIAGKARVIGGGRSMVIFLDLTLNSGTHPQFARPQACFRSTKEPGSISRSCPRPRTSRPRDGRSESG